MLRLRLEFLLTSLSACLLLLASIKAATAADTVECFDPGPSDAEIYLSFNAMGRPTAVQSLDAEVLLGYGLTPRLSAFLGTVLDADGNLLNAATETSLGIFGTVLDSGHWDLDLWVDANTLSDSGFTGGPGLEVNWDAAPDLQRWGLYTRAALAVSGRVDDAGPGRTSDIELTFGAYRTFPASWQLLLEYDTATRDAISHIHGTEKKWTQGGWALGCNGPVGDHLELITQLYVDVPDDRENYGVGVMAGFIATFGDG